MSRLTRAESQQRTLERLLAAARNVFARHGFAAASVDEITRAAGFSRGAFYSNFESKDELFLALVERQMAQQEAELRRLFEQPLPARARLIELRDYFIAAGQDREWCLLTIEFQLYAARHPRLRARLADLYTAQHHTLVRFLGQVEGLRPTSTAARGRVVAALLGVSEGLALQHTMNPTLLTAGELRAALSDVFERLLTDS